MKIIFFTTYFIASNLHINYVLKFMKVQISTHVQNAIRTYF